MSETTLFNRWRRLTVNEKAILALLIKENPKWDYIHQGLIPMMSYEAVANWLMTLDFIHRPRALHVLRSKLLQGPRTGDLIDLNDGLVFKRFGQHPERGVAIPGLPNHNRYRERRPFERKKDAYDISHPVVGLKHIGHNRWIVFAKQGVREHVLNWLQQNLGVKP